MKTKILVASALLLAGCPAVEKTGETPGGGGVPCEVQERFDTYCQNDATCHVAGGQAPDLSAGNAASSLTGTSTTGVPYLTRGDTGNSFLAQKLQPGTVGQMPPVGQPQPTPEDVAFILGWIAGAPFPEEGCATATSTMGMTMTDTDMMTTSSSSGPGEPQFCTLELIDSSVDPAMAVVVGDTGIPPAVGDVLLRNCGCHYVETPPMEYGAAYTGTQGFSTLADFQGEWMGSIPGMLEGMPAYVAIAERLDFVVPMPPPAYCDPDGEAAAEHEAMTQADYDLLMHWLGMMAPDGASYTPP